MAERDKLKREKCFPEYKKLRKKVKILVRKATTKNKNAKAHRA